MDIQEELKKRAVTLDLALAENRAGHPDRAWGLVLTVFESMQDLILELQSRQVLLPDDDTLTLIKQQRVCENESIHEARRGREVRA